MSRALVALSWRQDTFLTQFHNISVPIAEHVRYLEIVLWLAGRGGSLGSRSTQRTTWFMIRTPHRRTRGDNKLVISEILECEYVDSHYQFGFVKNFCPCALAVTLASFAPKRRPWPYGMSVTRFVRRWNRWNWRDERKKQTIWHQKRPETQAVCRPTGAAQLIME